MWIWVVVTVAVIGGILGFVFSDKNDKGEGAAQGATAGGCMALSCIMQIALTLFSVWLLFKLGQWLFG